MKSWWLRSTVSLNLQLPDWKTSGLQRPTLKKSPIKTTQVGLCRLRKMDHLQRCRVTGCEQFYKEGKQTWFECCFFNATFDLLDWIFNNSEQCLGTGTDIQWRSQQHWNPLITGSTPYFNAEAWSLFSILWASIHYLIKWVILGCYYIDWGRWRRKY